MPVAEARTSGQSGFFVPFHRDANTFQVDQVWFGLGKPATEESRGGFRFDIFYGATASNYGAGIFERATTDGNGDSTSDYVDRPGLRRVPGARSRTST